MLSSPAVAHGRPPASHQRALGRGILPMEGFSPPRPRGAAGELSRSAGKFYTHVFLGGTGAGAVPFPPFGANQLSQCSAAPPPYQERSMSDDHPR